MLVGDADPDLLERAVGVFAFYGAVVEVVALPNFIFDIASPIRPEPTTVIPARYTCPSRSVMAGFTPAGLPGWSCTGAEIKTAAITGTKRLRIMPDPR